MASLALAMTGENFSARHSGARRRREPGIHNHHREYGFRARAKAARPGMTVVGMLVIARSDSDEAIHTCFAESWIASLALAMTGLERALRDGQIS
jgi:hypothetical protein